METQLALAMRNYDLSEESKNTRKTKIAAVNTQPPPNKAPFKKRLNKFYVCEKNGHFSVECNSFTAEKRKQIMVEKGLCRACLIPGHDSSACRKKPSIRCSRCQLSHPTAFHELSPPPDSQTTSSSAPDDGPRPSTGGKSLYPATSLCTINTVKRDGHSRPVISGSCNGFDCSILLDTGAVPSLVHPGLVIGLEYDVEPLIALAFNGMNACELNKKATIILEQNGISVSIEAYISTVLEPNSVLIGTDMLGKILTNGSNLDTISGRIEFQSEFSGSVCAIEVSPKLAIKRLPDGRYEARLPFFGNSRPRSNFMQAKRFNNSMCKRLWSNDRVSMPMKGICCL